MPMTNAGLAQKLLNHIFGKGTFAVPSGIWVALCTNATTPNATTAGTIPTYTGYNRVQVAAGDWTLTAQTMKNSAVLGTVFPNCTVGGDTLTYAELWDDADTGHIGAGNRLAYEALTSPVVVSTTATPPYFPQNTLTVTFA